jgi:hypothetical protein
MWLCCKHEVKISKYLSTLDNNYNRKDVSLSRRKCQTILEDVSENK